MSERSATAQAAKAEANGVRAAGVRAIVAYKLAKGCVQWLIAVTIAWLAATGYAHHAHEFAVALRDHVAHQGSLQLAEKLLSAITPHRLYWLATALALDGGLCFFEGWALARGFRWAPWLIVGATSCLLPFEIFELIHRPRVGRFILLAVNGLIVWYLARNALREQGLRPAGGN
jgi:uncharacterized membrane protein (DUF2068 family)